MNSPTIAVREDGISGEIRACWAQLPNKPLFFGLLAAWLLLFQFLGNSTLGYIPSPSLFKWMYVSYNSESPTADDGHANLIPFIVVGLFWWKRKELLALKLQTWWPGLILVGLGLFFHLAGYIVQQQRLCIVGFFIGLYGLTGLAWGWNWLRASFFPFFLFAFMVPLGSLTEVITFPLRLFVTWIVEHLFNDVLGISVLRQGTQLFNGMGTYQFEVAAACSGIRSLISIFLMATIYGFVVFRSPAKRLIMIASGLPLAVIGNVVRLALIVAAGEFYGGQDAGNYVHDSSFFSLSPYVPAIFGLMWLGRRLEDQEVKEQTAGTLTPETKTV